MLHCRAWPPYWFGFLLQVIKSAVFFLTLSTLGIYVPHLISLSELKITPMCTEPENVLSISSCWRHQWAKTYPALSPHACFTLLLRPSLLMIISNSFPLLVILQTFPLSLSVFFFFFFFFSFVLLFQALLTPPPMTRC